jgi:ABC-type transporter Mla maintaining outer membrane lipid asymmetry ATPase subunit MlaF
MRGNTLEIRRLEDTGPGRATFMVLHDARVYFEGSAQALLASRDEYLREFLYMTLPPW